MIPRLAIITQNTLEATGLKSILDDIIPGADVTVFNSIGQFQDEHAITPFVHFFVSPEVLILDADFFLSHARQTIVITARKQNDMMLKHFHIIDISRDQHALVKEILKLHSMGHGNRQHPGYSKEQIIGPDIEISNREAEVLALVAKGFINKEIAEKLCISLPTVITHRKNICEKLHIRSVSALTIYAVTHGIVAIDEI